MKIYEIKWCLDTLNLYLGCTPHEGCDKCCAVALSKRYGHDLRGNPKLRRVITCPFDQLNEIQRVAMKSGEPRRVYIRNITDSVTLREELFSRIDEGQYPDLIFLLLTKKPSNILEYIPLSWKTRCPDNVMFGTSIVNQSTTDRLIPRLLKVPGYRFLSIEPQLDELTLKPWISTGSIHGVIQGGDSGPKRRPFNNNWASQLKDECIHAGVPYFFKNLRINAAGLSVPAHLSFNKLKHG